MERRAKAFARRTRCATHCRPPAWVPRPLCSPAAAMDGSQPGAFLVPGELAQPENRGPGHVGRDCPQGHLADAEECVDEEPSFQTLGVGGGS